MELTDGGTLRTVLDDLGRVPPELALFVAAETLEGSPAPASSASSTAT